MIAFLCKFKDLVDVGEFYGTYTVVDSSAFILQFKTQQEAQKINELSRLISAGNLTEDNIKEALQSTRKITLDEFKKLLENKDYWKTYQSNFNDIKGTGEEAVWHHFLKKNDWILGLNADVRFIRDLLSEIEVGISNTDGSGSPKVDLLGVSDYTVLIELKTSNTPIFTQKKKETGRANTWSFSSDFIDGVSQCLGQKYDWEKNHNQKILVSESKDALDQHQTRTVDPKSVFLIGNKVKEIPEESKNTDIQLKRDTFQRFRRNNRNLDIITFDELYERAYFIVLNKKLKPSTFKGAAFVVEEDVNTEELPF